MKTTENPAKCLNRVFAYQANFYVVRSGVIEKQPSVHQLQKPTGGHRITAEEAAKRIVRRFGRSLAVLAD